MAKFNGTLVVLEETNLESLFYYRYLISSYNDVIKAPPVSYYDNINKKGIDEFFDIINLKIEEQTRDDNIEIINIELSTINQMLDSVNKTVCHGFVYNTIQDNIRDEGLANKLKAVEAKKIKNYEEPYNDIFKKYSVHVYNG